ncbi:hypothetical protein UCRPA7_758 [Phaeoacremonium minimum UCRPA7]|uniref:Uncharacterized protein n=1 Tax=Phaeoacremonium minimum (strain UCR-PA7) TaxID=1286976 RepID=R8BWE1_PHAM7|nr:hypothetical protein UCRPA7_758 [Phaeoacremonium minimum UCRPA7]EOO03696.1 hypothetical protein UCRPA7_758 [Phaeoacremonium minimum UCRPA7]
MPFHDDDAGRPRLTKANVRTFANATKCETAHRRGEPTPSPEPLHLGDSNDTERFFEEHPLLRRDRAANHEYEEETYESWKPAILPISDQQRVNAAILGDKLEATMTAANPPNGCNSNIGQTEPVDTTATGRDGNLTLFENWKPVSDPFGLGLGSIFGRDGGGPLKPRSQSPTIGHLKPDDFQQTAANPSFLHRDAPEPEGPRARSLTRQHPEAGRSNDLGTASFGDLGRYTVEQANPPDFGQAPEDQEDVPASTFPQGFPRYRSVSDFREIAIFLANAQYVVSLGGLALKDMKYGIVVVPSGEEKLLLTKQPEDVMTSEFLEDIKWADYKARRSQEGTMEPVADGTGPPAIANDSMERGDAAQEPPVADTSVAKRKRTRRGEAIQAIAATPIDEAEDPKDDTPTKATRRGRAVAGRATKDTAKSVKISTRGAKSGRGGGLKSTTPDRGRGRNNSRRGASS